MTTEREKMVQTTVRLDADKLREAQYYLSLERISLAKFFGQKMDEFLDEYRKKHPEYTPRGKIESVAP
jgi:hypothetical protein